MEGTRLGTQQWIDNFNFQTIAYEKEYEHQQNILNGIASTTYPTHNQDQYSTFNQSKTKNGSTFLRETRVT